MSIDTTRRRAALAAVCGPVAVSGLVVGAAVLGAGGDVGMVTVGAAGGLAVALVLVVTIPIGVVAERVLRRLDAALPGGRFHDAVTDVAIGLDARVALLVRDAPEVDVIGLPTSERETVVVTTTAFDVLTRREIVALAAARIAAMRDPWCRLATNAVLVWFALRFVLPLGVVVALVGGSFEAAFAAMASLLAVVAWARGPEFARDRCADAVAIRTAQDPGGLAGAVRRLSGLGRRRDDLAAGSTRARDPLVAVPRLAGGAMTTDVGFAHRRRRYVLGRLGVLAAADERVGMQEPAGLTVVSGQDLRRRWAHLARPVDSR